LEKYEILKKKTSRVHPGIPKKAVKGFSIGNIGIHKNNKKRPS
jgi:hypothetical protein